ncbi:hypothetical protein CEY12_01555 [Chryseobacterium sp. T16E-39]|uniref:hypothetical protein n=1 Tax=Chryseobacterium sp. T16E-39 TaxID=2015076 RepID=UPI000B5B1B93|nr:hypothetical protein [Chryseobacterium sp. T16E-39]ASK28872.1 hypothetical protein CEY12_01555 [Chryseobacterium sp. T16E-39]
MEKLIRAVFTDVIENKNYDEVLINKYFSEDYQQNVDNVLLDFNAFKKHIQKLKEKVSKQNVVLENIATNETSIFTKHYVTSILKNGETVKHKVFAEFKIKNNKVVNCDELTILLEGDSREKKLGSEI